MIFVYAVVVAYLVRGTAVLPCTWYMNTDLLLISDKKTSAVRSRSSSKLIASCVIWCPKIGVYEVVWVFGSIVGSDHFHLLSYAPPKIILWGDTLTLTLTGCASLAEQGRSRDPAACVFRFGGDFPHELGRSKRWPRPIRQQWWCCTCFFSGCCTRYVFSASRSCARIN